MTAVIAPAQAPPTAGEQIRVLVADDSAVIRSLLTRTLESDPGIAVIASAGNGRTAVDLARSQRPDIVLLDVDMPIMDGLEALPLILAASPKSRVIVASTLTKRNADISIRALRAGASDYIPKPSTSAELTSAEEFRRELLSKVRSLGRPRAGLAAPASPTLASPALATPCPAAAPAVARAPASLRFPDAPPEVIAIGSSTGGPQALFQLLGTLVGIPQPILLTQHMPATFTTILAEHIQRQCGLPAAEAIAGEPPRAGRVHVAPGEHHMVAERIEGGRVVLNLNREAPENYCRPSVDVMLRSVARVWGGRTLVVMLTGMGQDGMEGTRAVVAAGGAAIAQDEATSVVWGMPGAVANAGLAAAILPLAEIGPKIRALALRGGRG